jgi:hypothetical protein
MEGDCDCSCTQCQEGVHCEVPDEGCFVAHGPEIDEIDLGPQELSTQDERMTWL